MSVTKAEGPAAWAINVFSQELVAEFRERWRSVREQRANAMAAGNAERAVYLDTIAETLAHIVDAIEAAAKKAVR